MKVPRAQWAGRTARPFVEAAEVLGTETDLIMAAMEKEGRMYVLFTPVRATAANPDTILGAVLKRGTDGVLAIERQPEAVPEVAEALKQLRQQS